MFKKYFKFLCVIFIICITYLCTSTPNTSLIFPIKSDYILTSSYGPRSFDNSFHNGIDCAAYEGTPVYAMADGVVTFSGFNYSGGNMLIIEYNNGYKSMYCHLGNNILVKLNDKVYQGKQVGTIGPKYVSPGVLNGDTTGVHLHFTLYFDGKSIDPLSEKYV